MPSNPPIQSSDVANGLGPKEAKPISEIRQNTYTTDQAIEVFESLLIRAAAAPVRSLKESHPLALVQMAKALIGLRPERPSQRIMDWVFDICAGLDDVKPDRAALAIDPEDLGLTISVFDLEDALRAGDRDRAAKNLGRLLLVSDNSDFIFDILLDQVARSTGGALAALPLVHSAQRAANFMGRSNLSDFLLPALDVALLVASSEIAEASGKSLGPKAMLTRLHAADPAVVALVAHAAQIEADEHVKKPHIMAALGIVFGSLVATLDKGGAVGTPVPGDVDTLLTHLAEGLLDEATSMVWDLGDGGERVWILEVIEKVPENQLSDELFLWADSFRMLYRIYGQQHHDLLAGAAVIHLAKALRSA